jgi:hypothetical protein
MSWDAPTAGARPTDNPAGEPTRATSVLDAPSIPSIPPLPHLPEQTAPTIAEPAVHVLGDVAPIAPEVPNAGADAATDPSSITPTPKWKKRKKSSARRLVSVLLTLAVMTALGAGAWFGYQAMNPSVESPPPVPLRDRSDTIFGKTGELVDGINEQMPDQELLDEVFGETSD